MIIGTENRRFCEIGITPERLKLVASDYSFLSTKFSELPPRLSMIPENKLAKMGTRLVAKGGITYGDSVGGLAPSATGNNGTDLCGQIRPNDEVLFSPGFGKVEM